MNVTYTTVVGYSVTTSSSESLPNDGERSNEPKRLLFPKCDYAWLKLISVKHAFGLLVVASYSVEVVFINLYCNNGHSGKMVGFCKHKSSSLYNQAVEAKKWHVTPA